MIEVQSDRAVRVAALQQQVRECFGCSLRPGKLREVTPVFGRGDPAARMVIVGEAPGPEENEQGRPFIGPSGRLLSYLLAQAGIDEASVWITNTVACWPHEPGTNAVRRSQAAKTCAPTEVQVRACVRTHLAEQLRLIRPAVVVTLGATAACGVRGIPLSRAFAPQLCFERGDAPGVEGLVHDLDIDSDPSFTTKLLATYHPAYLLRRSFRTGMQPSKHAEAACVVRTFEAARVLTLQTQREAAQKGDK